VKHRPQQPGLLDAPAKTDVPLEAAISPKTNIPVLLAKRLWAVGKSLQ
jgi:hypothetical protein